MHPSRFIPYLLVQVFSTPEELVHDHLSLILLGANQANRVDEVSAKVDAILIKLAGDLGVADPVPPRSLLWRVR